LIWHEESLIVKDQNDTDHFFRFELINNVRETEL